MKKSTLLATLASIMDQSDKIKVVSDMAFDAADEDHS
eukprot:CAMPEP_0176379170 /NCGR_PEP_ID=MMETSP0126-20121128/30170_1 /TAXON_ID=141414 ORGANISM="Strombidinopsis acuminatum, Strain SPMC142" /NCGR_SAMPLE_ID=MMETSP0126 /ASSEMBLY_ACC=CAM_ASM_000229 /LENGTH=36 /DNA_ID= /DNA_START= /DNA_END= /DNA_ORIENTATION=